MDVVNALGDVILVAIALLLYPIAWLADNPVVFFSIAAIFIAVFIAVSVKADKRRQAEKEAREAAIAADPFKAVEREEIEFWNGVRSYCETEDDWQAARSDVIKNIEEALVYYEEQSQQCNGEKLLLTGYEKKTAKSLYHLELWQDGGLFDKPLSWGSYTFDSDEWTQADLVG